MKRTPPTTGIIAAVDDDDLQFPGLLYSSEEYIVDALAPFLGSSCRDDGDPFPLCVKSLLFESIPFDPDNSSIVDSDISSTAVPMETPSLYPPLEATSAYFPDPCGSLQTVQVDTPDQTRSHGQQTGSHDSAMRIHPYQQERWHQRYNDLVQYYQSHGHCNVPYVYNINPCLGQWVKRQRHQYKLMEQNHRSNLTPERVAMLSRMGFVWDSHVASWEEKFTELRAYHSEHGHCNVPCIYRDSAQLSTWIKRQRRQYRQYMANRQSTMNTERIEKLAHLGFVWDYYGGNAASHRQRKSHRTLAQK